MAVTEIINGIKCTFPVSRQESLGRFVRLIKEAVLQEIEDGKLPPDYLDKRLKEEGFTDEDIKELERQADEEDDEWN